jgi:hypothetical protein
MSLVNNINGIYLFLVVIIALVGCDAGADINESLSDSETITTGSGIADIIRNPVTANEETMDTSALAQITFSEEAFDFGEVDAGAVMQHTFSFTNTGTVPLIIRDVRSTCGCTVADWPRRPIEPGGKGEIPVTFDTKNKNGTQSKPITITANTYPNKKTIYMNGRVFGTDKE